MKIKLDDKAAERILRLKITSMLTDKEVAGLFNITLYELRKITKRLGDSIKLTNKDWIYGALRTLNKPTIKQISDYIDYKNRVSLTDKEIKQGLEQLNNEGHAYNNKDTWNYTQRLIEIFSNKTDEFVAEVELGYFDLKKFKKIYKPKDWDYLMYEVFQISMDNVKALEGLVSVDIDFGQYSYSLSCVQGD